MPDAFLEGLRIRPGHLYAGPARLLLGQGLDPFDRPVLLSSVDGANSWQVHLLD
jgi:hypothetical protein